MNTTPAQLRLAADILETGHPFEFGSGTTWSRAFDSTPFDCLKGGYQVRLVLATPPYPAQLHNPDNLTAEQVGVGYRLTVEGESVPGVGAEWWCGRSSSAWLASTGAYLPQRNTVRLPLSVPWPEPADPYAELKAAHAAGKVIEFYCPSGKWEASPNNKEMAWCYPPERYRIKPEPAFTLPPPPPGMRWHCEDGWTADDLPSGYRPMCVGEKVVSTQDEVFEFDEWTSRQVHKFPVDRHPRHRTTRPLTFNHAGKTWTWHRPGDPMPCDGGRMVVLLRQGREEFANANHAGHGKYWQWADDTIIGWRYAEPQTKTVPLGPEDVPPGSVFRGAGEAKDPDDKGWCLITSCSRTGIRYWRQSDSDPAELPWKTLHESGAQINRSLPLTGKWNPDAWEPCSKQIPA